LSGNTVSKVLALCEPVAKELNIRIWDIQFFKEGSDWTLKIIIDNDETIGLNDCENFSRKIDPIIEEWDGIEKSYCLEVSSPGINRKLTKSWHFDILLGKFIDIRLIRPKDGARDFKGILDAFSNNIISLKIENGEIITINLSETAFIKLSDDENF